MLLYIELGTKLAELGIVELGSVVSYQYLRDSKSTSDVFPDKIFHFELSDLGKSLSLGPFGEIIHGYDHKLFI